MLNFKCITYVLERERGGGERQRNRKRKREREANWFGEERANMHFRMHNNNNNK